MFSPRNRDALSNPLSCTQNSYVNDACKSNNAKRKMSSTNLLKRNMHFAQPNMANTSIIPNVDGTFVLSPRTSQTRPMTGSTTLNQIK